MVSLPCFLCRLKSGLAFPSIETSSSLMSRIGKGASIYLVKRGEVKEREKTCDRTRTEQEPKSAAAAAVDYNKHKGQRKGLKKGLVRTRCTAERSTAKRSKAEVAKAQSVRNLPTRTTNPSNGQVPKRKSNSSTRGCQQEDGMGGEGKEREEAVRCGSCHGHKQRRALYACTYVCLRNTWLCCAMQC